MVHKKNFHKKELCKKFQTGRCTKNPCWYTHELMTQPTPTQPAQPTPPQTQGFWQTQPNQVPPAWNRPQQTQTQQNPIIQRDPMMNQIIQMMKQKQIQISQMNVKRQASQRNQSRASFKWNKAKRNQQIESSPTPTNYYESKPKKFVQ